MTPEIINLAKNQANETNQNVYIIKTCTGYDFIMEENWQNAKKDGFVQVIAPNR